MQKTSENITNSKKRRYMLPVFQNKKSELPTFDNLAEQWLAEVKVLKKLSTYVKYRNIYTKYLLNKFQNYSITAINNELINDVILKSIGQNPGESISASIEKSIYCVINQVFDYANVAYHIQLPHIKRRKNPTLSKTVTVFNEIEQNNLLAVLYDKMDIYKLGVLLCMSTGLRLGEICSLKWSDIDIEAQILHVQRTVQRISVENSDGLKTTLSETLPKSVSSDRFIPLPKVLCKLLSGFKKEYGYFFREDKPLEPRTYQKKFKRYLICAGIEPKNFHALRHTFATNFIDIGADAKVLSEILGHADVKITLNRYVHPSMSTKRSYINTLFNSNSKFL